MSTEPTAYSILIVEDDLIIQKIIALTINRAGYSTSFASNGIEALEQIQKSRPDLIVSDVMMPEMDGYTLLYFLRSNPDFASIPVIFLTARGSGDDIVVGLDTGADDYLVKPIIPDELLASISTILARKNQPKADD
jgi:DNA-binding response OmpR family regulator